MLCTCAHLITLPKHLELVRVTRRLYLHCNSLTSCLIVIHTHIQWNDPSTALLLKACLKKICFHFSYRWSVLYSALVTSQCVFYVRINLVGGLLHLVRCCCHSLSVPISWIFQLSDYYIEECCFLPALHRWLATVFSTSEWGAIIFTINVSLSLAFGLSVATTVNLRWQQQT